MLKTKEDIKYWLDQYEIEKYTINDDLTVDVNGDVFLSSKNLTEIPVQFGIVQGYFNCSSNKLTSLKGSPYFVGKAFSCYENKLISLEFCPKVITGGIRCSDNHIESIKGFTAELGGGFYHSYNIEIGSKIRELEAYYTDKNFREIEVRLSSKELQSILSYQDLTENIASKNKTTSKKIKI